MIIQQKPKQYLLVTPTKNPIKNPTKSPLINRQLGQVAFMAMKGSRAQLNRVVGNITYSIIDSEVNSPLNVTIKTLDDNVLVPIKWTNVIYRVYNVDDNTTETKTISSCNPIANRIQGSTPNGLGGLQICPTIYKCIQTSNCTDDLRPRDGYSGWVDLRACICSKSISIREDVSDLLPNVEYQMQAVKIKATPTNSLPDTSTEQFIIGVIQCNSFIERELNCQFPRFVPNYVQQCQSEPIGCFDFSLGYAFGGFWNQNPKFLYNVPRVNWTISQYIGIASVLNNKTYSLNGALIDPFSSKTWTDYYWFPNVSSLTALEKTVTPIPTYTFASDITQSQPYNYQAGSKLPPVTVADDLPFTTSIILCTVGILFENITDCANLIWDTVDFLQWRYPAYTEYIEVGQYELVYSLEITNNYNFTGIEVYNVWGELCGRYLNPTLDKIITISCVTTPSNTQPKFGYLQVRYFGISNIWDIPATQLSASLPTLNDPLAPFVSSTLYSTSFYTNLIYSLVSLYNLFGLTNDISVQFPHRQSSTTPLTGKQSTYNMRYANVVNSSELSKDWDLVAASILQNNVYPRNYALEERTLRFSYITNPVNYSNSEDLDYLYRVWSTWLAPRICSEDVECRTAALGRCIFAENGPKQYWFNGPQSPDYSIPANTNEGGCLVYNTWEKGFYDTYTFGANCKQGYGPYSLEEWGKVIQSNSLVSQIYPNQFPFNQSSITPEQFESSLACKFPFSRDPINAAFADSNLCAGHGIVSFTYTAGIVENIQFFVFNKFFLTPMCNSLTYLDDEYDLYETNDIFNLQYIYSGNIITIINSVVYYNGIACLFTQLQKFPTYGDLNCGEGKKPIYCNNLIFFSYSSQTFSTGILQEYSPWIVYFYN
jgi:hypothetical protein